MKDTFSILSTILLTPPITPEEIQTGNWFSLPITDPVTDYLATVLWDQKVRPKNWLPSFHQPRIF